MRLRAAPEDFSVDEVPLYPPAGEGGHTFVRVRKRLRNTEQVARDLARAAGVPPRDVGYAGRKDRNAVTTQWFSVPALEPERAASLRLEGATVLEAMRHPHKLRVGQLRANRFRIVVRDVDAACRQRAAVARERLLGEGCPNRFGEQRFGRDGDNAERAADVLAGRARRMDRREARFLVSALQAAVFNTVLEGRQAAGALGRLESGDVAMVHASGGSFLVEDPEREAPRAEAFEISPTGPIFGTKVISPAGEPRRREHEALLAHGVPVEGLRPPRGIRLRGARRPLRIPLVDLDVEGLGGEQDSRACDVPAVGDAVEGPLVVRFELPPGSYATVVLEELLGDVG